MADIPTLVCRPQPYEDESLQSYLLRVQLSNGYERLSWLTVWLRDMTGIPIPNRLNTTQSVVFLEKLTQVTTAPVLDLYRMTLNRYIPVLALPETPLVCTETSSGDCLPVFARSKSTKRWSRPDHATAFCPACLRETLYHRLPWLLCAVFACPRHHIWLRDTCASCGKLVSVSAVVAGQCPHCGAILMDMPSIPLDARSISVQTNLMNCLQAARVLPEPYPPLSLPFIFRFLDGLCALTRAAGWEWESCYHPQDLPQQSFPSTSNSAMSTTQQGTLYVSAWQVLTDWATNFYIFLDLYRQRPGADHSGMRQILGLFYEVWLERCWRHPDMEPIQTAFNTYFVQHFPASTQIRSLKRLQRYPELWHQLQYIDVRNAARSLSVSPPKIMRLVRDGYVRVYPERDPTRPGYFVYRADLENVLQRQPEKAHIRDVATEFSVGMSVISEWIQAGLLQAGGARQLHGVSQPVLTTSDVEAFRRRLAHAVHMQVDRPADTVSLRETCIRNGKVGMNSTQLLQRILDGKLLAYHTHPDLQPFHVLWFDPQDVLTLTEQVKAENNWMGFLEVWKLLDVSRDVVHLWIERQLLTPVATFARALYFDRDAVLHFHARLIRSNELAVLLETSRSAISMWVRAGHLPVLSGLELGQGKSYIFDRHVIADWHMRYAASGEVHRVLGSSYYYQFLKKVRLGVYASTEALPQRFYRRCDLQHFQQELEQ